jgi:hypothetical protein
VTPSGAVDEIVDELADELDPSPKSSAAMQLKVVATINVRFHTVQRLIANIERKSNAGS